jgi:hypothetical protein
MVSELQEFLDSRADSGSQSLHVVDRNVTLSALNRAYVRPMQTSLVSKVFLRNRYRLAISPQISAKYLSEISLTGHEFTLDKMMSLRLQTLSSTS